MAEEQQAAAGAPAVDQAGEGEALARRIASIALSKKAADLVVLDMRSLVSYTDFLVICSGGTERQVKAIHDAVYQELKDDGRLMPQREEGVREARWILLDYLDVVVHVMTPAARDFYRLEQLWGEASAVEVGSG